MASEDIADVVHGIEPTEGGCYPLQVGDDVTLCGGGPRLTVEAVAEDKIRCVWFEDGKLRRESFSPKMLRSFAANIRTEKFYANIRGKAK